MVANTNIEWAHHTFNPWIGCQKVGPGCDHCYAEALSKARLGVPWGPGAERRRTAASTWSLPLRLNRKAAREGVRYRVFCSSLADVLDPDAPEGAREDLWPLAEAMTNLDWLFLTKRIGNARKMLPARWLASPPPNVWLGATIVNQEEADRDIPKLLATPAAKRFLSMEPLVGPVDLTSLSPGYGYPREMNALTGISHGPSDATGAGPTSFGKNLDWVIVGGESGPDARPMHPDWARSLRDQCAAAGVPFLFKQWGEWEASLDRERDDPDWRANYTNDYADRGRSKWLNLAGGCGFHGERFHVMRRVGKKAAGRLLDGVQHDGFPA